tara:strand:- start:241 stop:1218 length:978 start_codon:yes stop_codon:yes gene_type:complete
MKDKILITGAAGFIGSHLTEMMTKKGYKVVAFDRYNSNNDHGWLNNSPYKKDFEFILGDIRDYDSVNKAAKGCNGVMHLAALIGIPYSYFSPIAYVKTNIEGTYNLLEASKNNKIENIIITSTSEVYGTPKKMPISENNQINSQSPYAASKVAADQLALSYHRSFDLPVKILRPFNTYGPRQSNRAIIPTIINQCLNIKSKNLYLGNLLPTRDLNYVEDICNGFFETYKTKKTIGEIINVGSNYNISVKNLAQKIIKIMKLNNNIKSTKIKKRPEKSEVFHLKCNNKKIKKLTNWKQKIKLEKGLKKTIEWFKENYDPNKDSYHI